MKIVDVQLENVTVKYGNARAINNVSLEVLKGEFIALLGPSGCGKTTTLRTIAGLASPDEGSIFISGKNVKDVPIEKRNLGIVFQNYALWPHLSVFENVAFGLQMGKLDKHEIRDRVGRALELLKLRGFERRFSHELSGGQQQRVALARAIVINPAVLLLDEPLGALDKKLREEMQIELKQLQRKLGITTIFVTHDQEEALTLADRIAVMDQGIIQQLGTPKEIYEGPQNKFVSKFIGISNFIAAKLLQLNGSIASCKLSCGGIVYVKSVNKKILTSDIEVVVRPERMRIIGLEENKSLEEENALYGIIENMVYTGTTINYHVALGKEERIIVTVQNLGAKNKLSYSIGDKIIICWSPDDCLLFEKNG